MLVGFISFFKRGSGSQLITATLWSLGFMIWTVRTTPYLLEFADNFKLAIDTAMLVTLWVAKQKMRKNK